MNRYTLTETRDKLPQIINQGLIGEVDNKKSSSTILPTSHYKDMEKEIIRLEMELAKLRMEPAICMEVVEQAVRNTIRKTSKPLA